LNGYNIETKLKAVAFVKADVGHWWECNRQIALWYYSNFKGEHIANFSKRCISVYRTCSQS